MIRLAILTVLALTASWAGVCLAADFPEERRVLIVYGNPDIGPWEQDFNRITLEELSTNSNIPAIPEFLSLIQATASEQQLIAESLQLKYGQLQVDLVLAVLPEANSFVYNYVDVFAPDAATLFILPGGDVLDAPRRDNSVVLVSAIEEATLKTVELIPQLLPELQRLYIVGGDSDGDRSYLDRYEAAIARAGVDYEIQFLRGYAPDELVQELSQAPGNSAILLSTYDRDRYGQELRTMAVNTYIDNNVDLPIFATFDTMLQSGTMGGNMSSSTLYARTASRIALDILAGNVSSDVLSSDTGYIFNGVKLNHFGIDRDLLPEGSVVVNDPVNLWRDYYPWIIAGLVIIIGQLALIALLVATIRSRRIVESELKKAQRMEALGSLSGGIAHDFNNILMSIMANAELASMSPDDKDATRKRLGNILTAGVRAKDLIAQILMFSRQSASAERKPVTVCSMLEESAEHIRAFMPDGIAVELHCTDDLPAIEGDATQLHQIIMNLCVNAQHAMDDEGVIEISASLRRPLQPRQTLQGEVPTGEYVCITVTDNGKGIGKDELQHVFEPFFTTKPRGKGTGLGLALVYQMVKMHDGYIDIQSRPGRGTSVTLYFPTSVQTGQDYQDDKPLLPATGQGEVILLVDDDEMVLDASRQTLENLGYVVEAFKHPEQALQALKDDPTQFDAIFTDLSMPKMDGARLVTLARELREDIPAVICTGYSDALNTANLRNVTVLAKPCSVERIAKTLQQVLNTST